MYRLEKWSFDFSNEYAYKYAGRYGASGEKRAKKVKPTPEQIRKQNQTNRVNKLRRLIKANFKVDDIWATLKFQKGTRVTVEQLNECIKKFIAYLKYRYKKISQDFKWIYRKEIGRRGGAHVHFIINRSEGGDTDKLIKKAWKKAGGYSVNYECLYEQGGYEDLAEYIAKLPDEQVDNQLSLFPEEERKQFKAYSCSRNLIRPEPEVKECRRRTVRKLIENGPAATPGYYIDKNSIYCGTNPFTGMSYYRYTEYRLGADTRYKPPWLDDDEGGRDG